MKRPKFILVLSVALVLLLGVALQKYFFKSWTPYYQEKLYQAPRPLLVKALSLIKISATKTKMVLDLGAGAGNDTAYLLQNGWQVWAEDAEAEAIKVIAERTDLASYKNNLTLLHKSFVEIPWAQLPKFDLIYASYALPFAHHKDFFKIWQQIVNDLPVGGLFVGSFFGPDHQAFNWWTKRKMTLVSKAQLQEMLQDFKIELLEESHEKDDRGIFDHSFNVIARKC